MEDSISITNRHSREELLKMLKLEEAMVAAVGYGSSVLTPEVHLRPFRGSITCLNFGREILEHCDQCWLMDFVPSEYRRDSLPCHQIPLNQNGETVVSLEAAGERERMEQIVLAWLRGNIFKLEQETKRLGEVA